MRIRPHQAPGCLIPGGPAPARRSERRGARLTTVLALALGLAAAAGCAEIDEKASDQDANKLAVLRADLEEDSVLVEFQKRIKTEAQARGEDPDQYDNAQALKQDERFKSRWENVWAQARKTKFDAVNKSYKELASDVVKRCIAQAEASKNPEAVDKCVLSVPAAKFDPIKTVGIGALVLVLGVAGVGLYRSARRRIDPVAQAGQKLGLAVQQSSDQTTATGDYKGFPLKIEASAPEVGQGDAFLRVLVLSKVEAHTVVRFGPLAPPTGLDLPDLDAPEVHDARVPEGYKLRLSSGATAEELLSGDVGFQLRAFDPVDVRVHDGLCGVTCWQVPATGDKVVEFVDLAVAVARLYPQA